MMRQRAREQAVEITQAAQRGDSPGIRGSRPQDGA